MAMAIYVKTLTGKTFTLHVEASMAIDSFKVLIEGLVEIPPDLQRLIHGSVELMDGLTLADGGIVAGDVIHCVYDITGGGSTIKNTVDMIWKQLPVTEQPVKPANPHDRSDGGRIAQETFRMAVIRAGENYVARKPNLRNTKGKLIWEIIEGRLEQIPAISSRSEAEVMDPASENPEIG